MKRYAIEIENLFTADNKGSPVELIIQLSVYLAACQFSYSIVNSCGSREVSVDSGSPNEIPQTLFKLDENTLIKNTCLFNPLTFGTRSVARSRGMIH